MQTRKVKLNYRRARREWRTREAFKGSLESLSRFCASKTTISRYKNIKSQHKNIEKLTAKTWRDWLLRSCHCFTRSAESGPLYSSSNTVCVTVCGRDELQIKSVCICPGLCFLLRAWFMWLWRGAEALAADVKTVSILSLEECSLAFYELKTWGSNLRTAKMIQMSWRKLFIL